MEHIELETQKNERYLKSNGLWKGTNYQRLAQLWGCVLKSDITPQQVSLCLAQMHLSEMIDNPEDKNKPMDMTSCIFAYEAFQMKE